MLSEIRQAPHALSHAESSKDDVIDDGSKRHSLQRLERLQSGEGWERFTNEYWVGQH